MNIKNYQETVEALYPFLQEYLIEHGIDISKPFTCINPEHEDKNPSCSIAPSKNAFHCFGCGCSGGIFNAAHYIEGKPLVGTEFITENLLPLAKKFGITVDAEPLTEEQIYELDTYRAYRAASEYLTNCSKGDIFLNAITAHGWDEDICREYSVGGINDWKKFREHLKSLGFSASFLDDVDLGRKEIFGDDKLIYSIKDEHGRSVGFASRNLSYTEDKTNGAKYVNQRHTGIKCNIYKKSTRLFGFDRVLATRKKKTGPIYIFEGYSDVLTAVQHGIRNCVAIGGTSLSIDQVQLLKSHGYYNIILCLDGDETGQKRTADLLDTTLSGHKDLRVTIMIIPEGMDPDELLRARGARSFKRLKKWTAFEWRLGQFSEEAESEEICESMIPLIVNETSYITQEKMCESLAKATGISMKSVQAELNRLQNQREADKARDRDNIIAMMSRSIQKDPNQAEFYLSQAEGELFNLARKYDEDGFSEESCLSVLEKQKEFEEQKDGSFSGFILGPDLKSFEDAMCGDWKKDVWLCFGGKPNSGKTSFLSKMSYEIANHMENDALVIYHTIDDTAQQILPKFVCVAEGSRKLTLNQVMDPNYHLRNGESEKLVDKRDIGYSVIRELIRTGHLVIKDANDGNTIAYAEKLIKYYRQKYPKRNIVYVLDNFHKLHDFETIGSDERVRFKKVSNVMKNIATKFHICVITTVEYRKTKHGDHATNADIGETGQIEYDASLIAHLHNEIHEKGKNAKIFHIGGTTEDPIQLPRIEINIGKNKITAFKNRLFYDFFPESSDFVCVDERVTMDEIVEEVTTRNIPDNKTNFGY